MVRMYSGKTIMDRTEFMIHVYGTLLLLVTSIISITFLLIFLDAQPNHTQIIVLMILISVLSILFGHTIGIYKMVYGGEYKCEIIN